MDRPFPVGLVLIAVLLGWGTLISDTPTARYGGLLAVVVVTCALAYQVHQRDRAKAKAKRESDRDEFADPWDEPDPDE